MKPDARTPVADRGFSMIELLISMAITLGIGMVVFQLFLQNEKVFQDQNMILEMQQSAQAVVSMMSDELRMAGQNVPTYASRFDDADWEASQTFLDGSDADSILFRAGRRNGLGTINQPVTAAAPLTLPVGAAATLTVTGADTIQNAIGANTNRFVYLWGPIASSWTWVRAEITNVDVGTATLTIVPAQFSTIGPTFDRPPAFALEEAIGYRMNPTAPSEIQRGESGNFNDPAAPAMTYSAIGDGFADLSFTYLDAGGNVVNPTTLASRGTIRRVTFNVVAQTAGPLASTGEVRTYAASMTVYPPNVSY